MQLMRYVSSLRDTWDRFEATVGLVAAFMLAYGPFITAAFTLLFSLMLAEWSAAGIAAIVVAITGPMALWLTRMVESALKKFRSHSPTVPGHVPALANDDPTGPGRRAAFALQLASELPPLPLAVRVPLAIWWFAHFAAGTALVEFSDVLAREGILWDGLTCGLPAVVFGYLFHFAANVFLVLAVTACFRSPTVTAGVWQRRFAIDALLTFPLLLRVAL